MTTPTQQHTTANLDWARGHDGDYLTHLTASCRVLVVQEAKNVTLADLLPDGWATTQHGGEAERGSAVCWDTRHLTLVGRPGLRLGARPGRARMLTRYIATAHLRPASGPDRFVIAAHLPPSRYAWLWSGYIRRLRRVIRTRPAGTRWQVGCDANMPITRLARRLGGRAHGAGIVGWVVGPDLPVTHSGLDHWGEPRETDHPAVVITTPLS